MNFKDLAEIFFNAGWNCLAEEEFGSPKNAIYFEEFWKKFNEVRKE